MSGTQQNPNLPFAWEVDDNGSGQQIQPQATGGSLQLPTMQQPGQISSGSAQGVTSGKQTTTAPTMKIPKFLSKSEGIVMQSTTMTTTTSQHSMQLLNPKLKQIMLPDDKGILRPHTVRLEMCKQIKFQVEADQRNLALGIGHGQGASASGAFPLMGSLPSASSLRSSVSSISMQLQPSISLGYRDVTTTLRELYQMLDNASSAKDITQVKLLIKQNIKQREDEQKAFAKHFSAEGRKK